MMIDIQPIKWDGSWFYTNKHTHTHKLTDFVAVFGLYFTNPHTKLIDEFLVKITVSEWSIIIMVDKVAIDSMKLHPLKGLKLKRENLTKLLNQNINQSMVFLNEIS